MEAVKTIGHLIDATAQRDAIHVAILPVVADKRMCPGDEAGFVEEGNRELVGPITPAVGIVDPFLKEPVRKGDRFWLFLPPGSITSLRHDWTHPAVSDAPQPKFPESEMDPKEVSRKWLLDYAARLNCYDKDPVAALERLATDLRAGEFFAYGSDCHSFGDVDDADELKRHAEIYLGIKIDWERFSFSCSC